jgi:CubicO group peptidase (beta-lactamase class C family)/predicted transcriptional regulator YdeE
MMKHSNILIVALAVLLFFLSCQRTTSVLLSAEVKEAEASIIKEDGEMEPDTAVTDEHQDYAIVKKPGFDVVVAREGEFTTENGGNLVQIPLLWHDFNWSEDYFTLTELNPEGSGPVTGADTLGISIGEPASPKFNYFIGVEKAKAEAPPNFKTMHIPEATWAVFHSNGRSIGLTYNYIFGEWLPATSYQKGDAPTLEVYLQDESGVDYQIWMPIAGDVKEIPLIQRQEDWGRSKGFPNGDYLFDKNTRVGMYSGGLERDIPNRARVIQASSQTSPLKTQYRGDISYEWGSATKSVSDYLKRWPVTELVIVRKGEIWVEEYRFDRKPYMRFTSWSMAKSITSLLLGICLDKGLIKSLDDTADMYVEDLKGTLHGSISLRNLSNMSSGAKILHDRDNVVIYGEGFVQPNSDFEAIVKRWNDTQEPPGTRFNYNELCALTIGMVIREVTGMGLAEFCEKELWQPMGAEADAAWLTDSKGKEFNCVFFSARLRDWARLGQLVAQNGAMNGNHIISKEWIDQCSSWSEKDQQVRYGKPNPIMLMGMGYKTFFWHPREDGSWLMMHGAFGQVVLIDRKTQTVLVQTAVDGGVIWMRELLELFNAATRL